MSRPFTPTHRTGRGTPCEIINSDGVLTVVRVLDNAYWERERFTTRVVATSSLKEIPAND